VSRPVHLIDAASVASVVVGDRVVLDGPEGRHAVTVRRLRVGEALDLVDGLGTRVTAEVVALLDSSTLEATVIAVEREPEPTPHVTVIQALAKGDRGEVAVETMSEVGVDLIVPWQAERCVVQWAGPKAANGVAKWRRVAIEAGKQSRRARFADVTPLATQADLARRVSDASLVLVLDEQASASLDSIILPAEGEIVLIVGPEGGISPHEVATFIALGAQTVRLGPTVLRSSTAGTVAAAVVLARSGRWQVQ